MRSHTTKLIALWLHVLISAFIFISSAPIEENGEQDIETETLEFLQDYGYMKKQSIQHGKHLIDSDVKESLKRMQKFAGLKETGKIDADTILLEKTSRCGVPDTEPSTFGKRQKRYAVHNKKWDKSLLTWRIHNYGNDGLKKQKIREIFRDALAKWANVTNLSFIEIKKGEPDIWFKFVTGNHGDNSPFTQPHSRVIAHAFYPKYGTIGLAGDVHFNDDKVFAIKSRKGKNLLWITLHELGHSIGLKHSTFKDSIMYPYYRGYNGKDFQLTQDDIEGAQALYGVKTKTTQNTLENVSPKPKQRHQCISRITAIFLGADKKTYMFGKSKLVIFDKNLKKERGPISIWKIFKGVHRVDAAFRRHDGKAILFSGRSYFVFSEQNQYHSGPHLISETFERMPNMGGIDAAFIWNQNNALYLFKGDQYWRYKQSGNGMKYNIMTEYPKELAAEWKGIPDNIDAMFTWKDGAIYIFKGHKYYAIDKELKLKPKFPKSIEADWIKDNSCTDRSSEILEEKSSASKPNTQMTYLFTLMVITMSIFYSF